MIIERPHLELLPKSNPIQPNHLLTPSIISYSQIFTMADSQFSPSRPLIAESLESEKSQLILMGPTEEEYEAATVSQMQSFSKSSFEESEEFEMESKEQLTQPSFSFMASICGTMQEAEYTPIALHDLCLEMYKPDHPIARFVSDLTSNINQTFGAIAVHYPAYQIVEKNQRKWFEKVENTPDKFSQREVVWARRLIEIFKDLGKKLEAILTDTGKKWKNSSSNQQYFDALVSDKRTGALFQEMSIWLKDIKQLDKEVMLKQQNQVLYKAPTSVVLEVLRPTQDVHPLRRSGNAKTSSYENDEDEKGANSKCF